MTVVSSGNMCGLATICLVELFVYLDMFTHSTHCSSRHQKQQQQQFLHRNYSSYTFSYTFYSRLQSQIHFRMHATWEFSLLQAP